MADSGAAARLGVQLVQCSACVAPSWNAQTEDPPRAVQGGVGRQETSDPPYRLSLMDPPALETTSRQAQAASTRANGVARGTARLAHRPALGARRGYHKEAGEKLELDCKPRIFEQELQQCYHFPAPASPRAVKRKPSLYRVCHRSQKQHDSRHRSSNSCRDTEATGIARHALSGHLRRRGRVISVVDES